MTLISLEKNINAIASEKPAEVRYMYFVRWFCKQNFDCVCSNDFSNFFSNSTESYLPESSVFITFLFKVCCEDERSEECK